VYVADNPLKDFVAARRVGMATVRVRRPGGEYVQQDPPTEQHRADIVIQTLDMLEEVLERLEGQR
jgi:FMN phosphatase YigB (HAD superfamily)